MAGIMKYIWDKINKGVKSFDRYSVPVTLTVEGDSGFSTFVGGLVSFWVMIGFCIFAISELVKLANKEKIETSKNEVYFDTLTSDISLNLSEGGIAFAFRTDAFKKLTIEEEARFVTYTVSHTHSVYNPAINQKESTHTYLELADWDATNFILTESQKDFFNKNKGYRCFSDNNVELKGNFLADDEKTLQLKVHYCNQTTNSNWHALTDIQTAIQESWMDVLVANKYIDFNDIETPIKYQYDAKYYVSIKSRIKAPMEV